MLRVFVFALISPALYASRAQSQWPASIGQPPQWQHDAAVGALLNRRPNDGFAWLSYGVHRPITNPVTGLLGVTVQGYATLGGQPAGARLFADSRAVGLSAGVDWDIANQALSPIISFQTAVRRGGLLGGGSMARLDWLPTRRQAVALGVTVPLFRPLAGRTRPRRTHVHLPGVSDGDPPRGSAIDTRSLMAAAHAIGAFTNVYSRRAQQVAATYPGGYSAAIKNYDVEVRRLFAGTVADSATMRITERGRTALLDHVLLPVDSLFGQARGDPDDLSPLISAATMSMSRWLDSSRVAPASRERVIGAFRAWMDVVDNVHRALLEDAGSDSRLVWLPLELALTPDQFDDQPEVDSLLARVVGHPFTDRNALTYLRSADLPLEIARSIYATREYHVLWTHDFTGRRESGAIDNIGYSMVADAYLPALTAAVKRYDTTGVLPTFIILQDQFFYEPRGNRLWMDILENPLNASMRLRGDTGEREARLRSRQQELRAAVAASVRLQRDAAASGNADRWLQHMVKVHVNIVEPSDFSFRSSRTIRGLSFTPDNIMREHRKIVFYDLNEVDPYRGAMFLMGVGIGEHYASATWEDRGYRIRGPVTLEARRAVREALRRNGFSDETMPRPLQPVASAQTTERQMNVGDYVGRALQMHNEVGFGPKKSSIARAMLYNLAPSGSVIVVPDPMWLSDTWAGMLAGAAARGCRVYIIAPAEANTPSPQAPLVALQRVVLLRLLELRSQLEPQLRASSGELRVGLFAVTAHVNDAAGRAREIRQGLARAPWIRSVVPFDDRTLAVLEQAEARVANAEDAKNLAQDETPRAPQLHQKSQLIARPGAMSVLLRQPGWDANVARAIQTQSQETARFAEQLGYSNPDLDTAATRSTDALLRGYEQSLPESERRRLSFYFSLGTQNADTRGIVSDGEVTLIVSGVQASVGLVDLFFLMARSQWINTEAELNTFVPPKSGFMRRLGWLLRAAF